MNEECSSPQWATSSFLAPHSLKLSEKTARPPMHVELMHRLPQALHAVAALGGVHRQRPVNRLGGTIDVVGVYEKGVRQLVRGSREFAQHEDAIIIDA